MWIILTAMFVAAIILIMKVALSLLPWEAVVAFIVCIVALIASYQFEPKTIPYVICGAISGTGLIWSFIETMIYYNVGAVNSDKK